MYRLFQTKNGLIIHNSPIKSPGLSVYEVYKTSFEAMLC